MEEKIKMEPIPEYGDLMAMEEWISAVKQGTYIDYDGFGYLATKTEMSNIKIVPSNYKKVSKSKAFEAFKYFTHIVWFNR